MELLDQELLSVLSRKRSIDALRALTDALGTADLPTTLEKCTIALDSSIFLRLAGHEKSADVIDYLNGQHEAGIIIPGQSIQEFWNNKYNVIPSLSRNLRNSFDSFIEKVNELDGDFSDYKERFLGLIDEFESDYGHVFDDRTVSKTFQMLEGLQPRALVPYVYRQFFQSLSVYRQNTKTPPGFRDKQGNDGDFYVWLDTLRGAQLLKQGGSEADWLIFVTNDRKDDWSRDGMPHPILSAELEVMCGIKLCIVDLRKFLALVDQSTE